MNFVGSYRQLGAKALFLLGACAVLAGFALAAALPLVLAKSVGLSGTPLQERLLVSGDVAYGESPPCIPATFSQNLRAAVNLPAGMRVSETKQVVLDIGLVRDYLLLCELGGVPEGLRVLRAQAALESPGFDISPSSQTISVSRTDQVRWTWLIRPKSTGKHAVRIVTAGRDGLRIDLARILPPADSGGAILSADQLIRRDDRGVYGARSDSRSRRSDQGDWGTSWNSRCGVGLPDLGTDARKAARRAVGRRRRNSEWHLANQQEPERPDPESLGAISNSVEACSSGRTNGGSGSPSCRKSLRQRHTTLRGVPQNS